MQLYHNWFKDISSIFLLNDYFKMYAENWKSCIHFMNHGRILRLIKNYIFKLKICKMFE
jgi:hypothetical protein